MKVRITKAPTGGFGQRTGDQSGFGLYRNERFQGGQDTHSEEEGQARETYPEVDRERATIEAEKGELIITPGMERLMKIGGKKHSKGGTPIYAEGGEYVVSDHVKGPGFLKEALGFEASSNKKKDNTWAKLLKTKVDPKDYNRAMEIMEQASAGKEVDPYTLASAKNRIPDYQKYISRAALGNEVSKAFMGKPFEIPQVGIPALQDIMGQGSRADAEDHPMMSMRNGGMVYYKDGGEKDPTKIKKEELDSYIKKGYEKVGDKLYRLTIPGQAAQYATVAENLPKTGRFALQDVEPYFKAIIPQGHTFEEEVKSRRIKDTPEHRKLWEQMGGKFYTQKEVKAATDPTYDWITYDEDMPAAPGTGTKKEEPKTEINVPAPGAPGFKTGTSKFGRLPYVQDINNLGTTLANYFDRQDYAPTRYRYNPVYMNAPFVSTEAVDNLLMQNARTAGQEMSAYGRPANVQSAVLADMNARALPEAIKNRVATNAQNVQSDLATRQFNAQVANQAGMMDAQSADMFDNKRAMFIGNKQKSRATGRTMMTAALNQLLTNSGDTYVMNQRFPNMAFNPITYDVAFKGGLGTAGIFDNNTSTGNGMSGYNQAYKANYDALSSVEDPKMRADIARDQTDIMFGISGSRTTQRYNPLNPMAGTSVSKTTIPAAQKYGGPIYPWW